MKKVLIFILLNILAFNLNAAKYVKVYLGSMDVRNCEIYHLDGKVGEVVCDGLKYIADAWSNDEIYYYCVKINEIIYSIPKRNTKEITEEEFRKETLYCTS